MYIDYVRRSRSSSYRILLPITCQIYITLHYITNYSIQPAPVALFVASHYALPSYGIGESAFEARAGRIIVSAYGRHSGFDGVLFNM